MRKPCKRKVTVKKRKNREDDRRWFERDKGKNLSTINSSPEHSSMERRGSRKNSKIRSDQGNQQQPRFAINDLDLDFDTADKNEK